MLAQYGIIYILWIVNYFSWSVLQRGSFGQCVDIIVYIHAVLSGAVIRLETVVQQSAASHCLLFQQRHADGLTFLRAMQIQRIVEDYIFR